MMRWTFFCSAVLALAACGDDGAGTGGSGGTTGDGGSAPTGSGGAGSTSSAGGGTTYDDACAAYCAGAQTASDAIDCGTVIDCETRYCDGPTAACDAEQNALYLCYASELEAGNTDGCFCEGDGEIECEGLCQAERTAFLDCEDPLIDACIALEGGLTDPSCEATDVFSSCMAQADAAFGAGCGAEFDALAACLGNEGAACTCAGTDVECDAVCDAEITALDTCVAG